MEEIIVYKRELPYRVYRCSTNDCQWVKSKVKPDAAMHAMADLETTCTLNRNYVRNYLSL